MKTDTLKPFVSEEWFLQEKRDIDEALPPWMGDDKDIEEWVTKAKKVVAEYMANDSRTLFERASYRDKPGKLALKMMRRVQTPFFILRALRSKFEADYSEQEFADLMHAKFVRPYELYLKRVYLMEKGEMIMESLINNHDKDISEQFLYFISNYKTNCLAMGIKIKDFEFAINTTCDFWSPSIMQQVVEKLENEA